MLFSHGPTPSFFLSTLVWINFLGPSTWEKLCRLLVPSSTAGSLFRFPLLASPVVSFCSNETSPVGKSPPYDPVFVVRDFFSSLCPSLLEVPFGITFSPSAPVPFSASPDGEIDLLFSLRGVYSPVRASFSHDASGSQSLLRYPSPHPLLGCFLFLPPGRGIRLVIPLDRSLRDRR